MRAVERTKINGPHAVTRYIAGIFLFRRSRLRFHRADNGLLRDGRAFLAEADSSRAFNSRQRERSAQTLSLERIRVLHGDGM